MPKCRGEDGAAGRGEQPFAVAVRLLEPVAAERVAERAGGDAVQDVRVEDRHRRDRLAGVLGEHPAEALDVGKFRHGGFLPAMPGCHRGTTYGAMLESFSQVSSYSRSGVEALTMPAPARSQARPSSL